VLDLAAAAAAEPASSDRESPSRRRLRLASAAATAAALDVRDKATSPPSAARVAATCFSGASAVGCVAALALLAAGELALLAGRGFWQKNHVSRSSTRKNHRRKIIAAQKLANRVDELATKRLLPFEMIFAINQKRPAAIQFQARPHRWPQKLVVEAITCNAPRSAFSKPRLEAMPDVLEKVDITAPQARDNITTSPSPSLSTRGHQTRSRPRVMIRTLRAFFPRSPPSRKLLLVASPRLPCFMWLSSYSRRAGQIWREQRATTVTLA